MIMKELSNTSKSKPYYPKHILVRKDKNLFIGLDTEEIIYLKAERFYCEIHTKDFKYVMTQPMSEIRKLLNPEIFTKIDKSHIVNTNSISEISGRVVKFIGTMKEIKIAMKSMKMIPILLPVVGIRLREIEKLRARYSADEEDTSISVDDISISLEKDIESE